MAVFLFSAVELNPGFILGGISAAPGASVGVRFRGGQADQGIRLHIWALRSVGRCERIA